MHARCEYAMMILNTCKNYQYTVDQDQIKKEKSTFVVRLD